MFTITFFVYDLQACKAYFKMLREVYGPEKVLAPYILNIDAVKEYDGAGQPLPATAF